MPGYKLPAARSVREFLKPFHVEEPLLWRTGEKSAVPEAAAPLAGVGAANRRVLAAVQQQTPHHTATMTYTGLRGYQPIIAAWAEQDLIVHDEFRGGNVLAGAAVRQCAGPGAGHREPAAGITQILVQGDSALYEHEVLA